MATDSILKITEKGISDSINEFLKILLAKKLVQAVLLPVELKGKITLALVNKPDILNNARPLAPVMPVSAARMISNMTKVSASGDKKTAVVLRSCELRALIELVKLKQASLDNLLLIGIDCFGTFSKDTYESLCKLKPLSPSDMQEGNHPQIREACQVCEYPAPLNADLVIGLFGMPLDKEMLILAATPAGESTLSAMGPVQSNSNAVKDREKALSNTIATRKKKKAELFTRYGSEVKGMEKLQAMFASCVNCHNCRVACPLCYCRECFFDSPTFEWKADSYLGWAEKRGALAMPNDRLLFHLTRLNHMVASCVGCGLCQEACPNNIEVFKIFRLTGDKVQASLNYIPGRSLEDELPVSTFREDELGEIGK
jgi:formate dehydrogenase subunit beta